MLIESGEPPQLELVESQKSPVIRQPSAVRHTVVPEPGSEHTRVQQPDVPEHGLPSWTQPPGASTHRPGWPPVAEQMPEQQSSVR